jgi:hypothetical protein
MDGAKETEIDTATRRGKWQQRSARPVIALSTKSIPSSLIPSICSQRYLGLILIARVYSLATALFDHFKLSNQGDDLDKAILDLTDSESIILLQPRSWPGDPGDPRVAAYRMG